MSHDDPFSSSDPDRTIFIPSPGGHNAPPPRRPPVTTQHSADGDRPSARQTVSASGLNPLVAAANPLLDMVPQLRATLQHPDPQGLRDSLVHDIKEFERRAQAAQVPSEKIVAARYALCTLLDETAASTPWGSSGLWAKNSLLITFHNESWGGEKFFQLLSKLAENPAPNLDLLELMYVCLALGLEGRYRVADNGAAQLAAIRERLAQLIRKQHGEYERDLSPHWQGAPNKRYAALSIIPIWAVVALCALILLAVFITFSTLLNNASDPVYSKIQGIRVAAAPPPPKPPPAPRPPKPRLAPFLAKEIAAGSVAVKDEDARSVVTILGDRLFSSGSATIAPEFEPLVSRIADALNSVPGPVLVTGHTDNVPIRGSLRFPSNWHLSQERAHSVAELLASKVTPPSRLTSEGRADTEPIAPNDSVDGRARNRRVEITLFFAPEALAAATRSK